MLAQRRNESQQSGRVAAVDPLRGRVSLSWQAGGGKPGWHRTIERRMAGLTRFDQLMAAAPSIPLLRIADRASARPARKDEFSVTGHRHRFQMPRTTFRISSFKCGERSRYRISSSCMVALIDVRGLNFDVTEEVPRSLV
jgi:hypothetical protein